MPRIDPLAIEQLAPAERTLVDRAEQMMGFVANDALTMAGSPRLLHAFARLVEAVYAPGRIDDGLRRLIGLQCSAAAGCRYCVGHTAHGAQAQGMDETKLAGIFEFETSPAFTAAERAALTGAQQAGQTPNGVTDEMFAQLAVHFDQEQQLEIVAVIALFGFLNRWNSTLATELESGPAKSLAGLLDGVGAQP